jgi:thiamine biosynthesis lipoprotein
MLLDFLLADEPEAPGEFSLIRVSRRAMATTFEVAIPVGSLRDPVTAAEDALDLIDQVEDQMTVFRDHSEVSRLNEAATIGFVEVEPRLFELFGRCAIWTKETAGAFDIATGALTKAWGFYRREGRVPPPRELVAAMRATGFRHVVLDAERRAVKFRVRGLELNLGAVGKGYALDRAAELLRTKWGVRSALLHGGGSSAYAIGSPPGDARGWPVRLKHPHGAAAARPGAPGSAGDRPRVPAGAAAARPGAPGSAGDRPRVPAGTDQSLGIVYLRDAGLGTSAATFQFFEYNGRKLGHLLDPRTGWPATGTASASVVAPTAAEADAMSTAAFVLGAEGAQRLTRLRPALGAVVLRECVPLAPRAGQTQDRPTAFNLAPDAYSPPE